LIFIFPKGTDLRIGTVVVSVFLFFLLFQSSQSIFLIDKFLINHLRQLYFEIFLHLSNIKIPSI